MHTYTLAHEHKHGLSSYVFTSNLGTLTAAISDGDELTDQDKSILAALEIDFEPELMETIQITLIDVTNAKKIEL